MGWPLLVVDHVQGLPLGGELQHGGDEVAAVLAVEPGGADDAPGLRQQLPHGLLADQLAAPIGVQRVGGGVLGVGGGAVAVQHVVGGDVQQPGAGGSAGGGQVADDRCRSRRWRRPPRSPRRSTSVQAAAFTTMSWPTTAAATASGSVRSSSARVRAVVFASGSAASRDSQVLPEHSGRTDDQPGTGHRESSAFAFSGSHQSRLSRYQATVSASPSLEGDLRGVAQLLADLADVDGVAQVVALAVLDRDAPYSQSRPGRVQQQPGQLLVGHLGAAADVVDLARPGPCAAPARCRGSGRTRAASPGRCRRRRTAAPCLPSSRLVMNSGMTFSGNW